MFGGLEPMTGAAGETSEEKFFESDGSDHEQDAGLGKQMMIMTQF